MPWVWHDFRYVADFLIAAVRTRLQCTYESYVKWNLVNAWAGAILGRKDVSLELLLFPKSDGCKENPGLCWRSEALSVYLYSGDTRADEETIAVLPEAYEKARIIAACNPPESRTFQSVTVAMIFQANQPDSVAAEFDNICRKLSRLVDWPFFASPISPFAADEAKYESDITFRLPKQYTPTELAASVDKLFPRIKHNLPQQELITDECADPHVSWCHAYARHFFEVVVP
jgi:hypothetical protein